METTEYSPYQLVEYSNATSFQFDALLSRNTTLNPQNCSAFRCSMFPCIKTYEASVTNGVYTESQIGDDINVTYVDREVTGFAVATNLTRSEDGFLVSCNATPHQTTDNTIRIRTDLMIPYNDTYSEIFGRPNASTTMAMWYPEKCYWSLGTGFSWAMHDFLQERWNGSYVQYLQLPTLKANGTYGDAWTTQLYNEGQATVESANAYMDGLAWSITAAMRKNSLDATDLAFVQGQAQRTEICVNVQWAWISLPAALLGLGILFLVAVIFTTRMKMNHRWQGDWKSSSLALMFHGLDESVIAGPRGELDKGNNDLPLRQSEMYDSAKQIKVKLRRGENGWRFSDQ